ncbi:MAG: 3-phosphoserine/phosphohydroxythreonine transaminase [Kiritimatiellia bacterium]
MSLLAQKPAYNFCAGPSMIAPSILEAVRADLTDWDGLGRTVLELSHRTPDYAELHAHVIANLHQLLGVGDEVTILLLQGGASGQFAMLPYNFLREGAAADYLVRGYWGERASQQAARVGCVRTLSQPEGWNADAVYAHVTTNETIAGTCLPEAAFVPPMPLCADMSSDILSRPRDYSRYALFYAGAQKNLGVAGLAVVVAQKEFLSNARRNLPAAFCYLEHAKAAGLYHTPNVFAVDVLSHVTDALLTEGLPNVFARNARKAKKLYDELDHSDFWRPLAPVAERSITNVTFRLPTVELEDQFLQGAEAESLFALRGHRALGGIRASLYNAFPEEGVDALITFMRQFEKSNG